jgi:hypothetical protein
MMNPRLVRFIYVHTSFSVRDLAAAAPQRSRRQMIVAQQGGIMSLAGNVALSRRIWRRLVWRQRQGGGDCRKGGLVVE